MTKIIGSFVAVHVMKAYSGNGITVKPILNFGTSWRFGLSHATATLPQGKASHIAY
jgi:hypothetical protein